MNDLLLGIDIGTTSTKVILISPEGKILAEATAVSDLVSPHPGWPQITSDVLGIPLEHIADHPGSSLGAAFVAGMGTGVFKDWGEIDQFLEVRKRPRLMRLSPIDIKKHFNSIVNCTMSTDRFSTKCQIVYPIQNHQLRERNEVKRWNFTFNAIRRKYRDIFFVPVTTFVRRRSPTTLKIAM